MDASKDHIDELETGDTEDIVSLSICRKKRRPKAATKVNQRKSKSESCLCRRKYYNPRASLSTTTSIDQDFFIPSIPCHAIFVFLDTILLGVLQVVYQNKNESPLDAHPLCMQAFLTAICIYSTLLGIKVHMQTHGGYQNQILSYALLFSGTLSSASLLSILLQRQILWVVLFICGSTPPILARHLLKSLVRRIIEMVAKLCLDVRDGKFGTVVLIFNNKDSASGSNDTTYPTDVPVEGIP